MEQTHPQFELWLETEIGEPNHPANQPQQNFCNINITFDDGRFYALNVWTFDFLPLARFSDAYETTADATPANYILPPDLFVASLTRELITSVIIQMIANGKMKDEWLVEPEDPKNNQHSKITINPN